MAFRIKPSRYAKAASEAPRKVWCPESDVLINAQEFKDNLRHPSLFAHSLMDLREKL
jgi:hypothetical protein